MEKKELERELEFTNDGEKWKVEGIDHCEDLGWIVYYYPAGAAAPIMLNECEHSSIAEVLLWAKGIEWQPQEGDSRREYEDNYEKLKVAELKSKCEELGIELSNIPHPHRRYAENAPQGGYYSGTTSQSSR